ncbi:ribonuclease T [Legionella sp. W05-934-2]|uniref:ribonuclease T2 family protein n=1 Tax=Legionella sp. W05-934-2 TaxID=1198649 RepID=UPI003462C3B7
MKENAHGFMMKLKPCAVFLLLIAISSHAFVPIQGSFQATASCPAYLSKNQKTNPDNIHLALNQVYDLVEANKASHPDWYRIRVDQTSNPLRWVSAGCGLVNETSDLPGEHCNQQPGYADSYMLALSWQPAFCETYGYERGKAECYKLTKKSYTATHLALHGLWPNQTACGIDYGYCQAEKQKNHCDYPPIHFTDLVAKELAQVMPSYSEGSCLERHEWNRHGSCQLLDQNDYFDTASQLAKLFDKTGFGELLRKYNGGYVPLESLKQAFIKDFGEKAIDKLYLGCQQGMLVDVWISLPANVSLSMKATDMINQAPNVNRNNNCPKEIYISDFFK